ncbi:MAG TPA: hypothetical protein VF622_15495 [Segetibacter sp.]
MSRKEWAACENKLKVSVCTGIVLNIMGRKDLLQSMVLLTFEVVIRYTISGW